VVPALPGHIVQAAGAAPDSVWTISLPDIRRLSTTLRGLYLQILANDVSIMPLPLDYYLEGTVEVCLGFDLHYRL
jgi:hypothetical protein